VNLAFPGGLIRHWTPADAPELARLADNRKVWRNLRDRFPNPYSRRDAKDWIKGVTRQIPCAHFAICADSADGALAGGIGILLQDDVHKGTAEIGYWLGEAFWGRGLMTGALTAFSDHAFGAYRLRRLYAQVLDWNPASARVLEKSGFVLEGRLRASALKDGEVADELLYAKVK
jgi:ribosomal-protein-alanine N-acetyltransferase